jgi:hypothetical protein
VQISGDSDGRWAGPLARVAAGEPDGVEVTRLANGLWRWTAPHPDWKPGDVFVAANERAFRIVETDAEVEVAGMVLFDAIWTVEPLEE